MNGNPKSKSKPFADSPMFNLVLVALALLSMVFLALSKTICFFAAKNADVICGVFSIFVYALPIIGIALAYLVKRGKPSLELFLNVGALVASLWFL